MPQSLYCVCRTTPPLSRCLLSKCWGLYTLAEKYAVLWAVKLTRTEDGSLPGSVCPDSHLPSAPSDSRGWTKQKTMKARAKTTNEQASWRLFQGPHRIQQTPPLKAPRGLFLLSRNRIVSSKLSKSTPSRHPLEPNKHQSNTEQKWSPPRKLSLSY